jgi:flagellar basal body rod protein FlgG
MDPIATAQYGMFAAAQRFSQSAEQVARDGGGEPVDLAKAVVEMANAQNALKANVEVMRTADQMLGVILNISA